MWDVLRHKRCEKQLRKLDPQVSKEILEDMKSLQEDPLQSDVADDERARKLGLRYIKVAHDWRVFFRLQGRNVLVEFLWHRKHAYDEMRRYLAAIRI